MLLRPIRPEDEPALRYAFTLLSPESIRMRFFGALKEMSHALGARLTQIDYEREMALVLTDPPGTADAQLYGVARISADPDNETAEYAIIVRDDMTGQGLGEMLMRRIIAYARDRGIGEIFGDVLIGNDAMLALCRQIGFSVTEGQAAGTVRVSLRL
jgi:acetyltransferase